MVTRTEYTLGEDRAFYAYHSNNPAVKIEDDNPLHVHWDAHLTDPRKRDCLKVIALIFWNALSILIPIIGLIRLGLYCATRWSLLPAMWESSQSRNRFFEMFTNYPKFILSSEKHDVVRDLVGLPRYRAEEHFVYTPDGVKLSIKVFRCDSKNGPVPAHLYFPGNSQIAGPLDNPMMDQCIENHYHGHFVSFDYRGVGDSRGRMDKIQDLVIDGYTVARWIEEILQSPPDQIHFYGFSLGGAIATETKALNPEWSGSLVSDRSFSSLAEEVRALVADLFGCLWIGRLVATIVRNQGHRLNPGEKAPSLQGKVIVLHHPEDPIIPPRAQLSASLGDDEEHEYTKISLDGRLKATRDDMEDPLDWNPHVIGSRASVMHQIGEIIFPPVSDDEA